MYANNIQFQKFIILNFNLNNYYFSVTSESTMSKVTEIIPTDSNEAQQEPMKKSTARGKAAKKQSCNSTMNSERSYAGSKESTS